MSLEKEHDRLELVVVAEILPAQIPSKHSLNLCCAFVQHVLAVLLLVRNAHRVLALSRASNRLLIRLLLGLNAEAVFIHSIFRAAVVNVLLELFHVLSNYESPKDLLN